MEDFEDIATEQLEDILEDRADSYKFRGAFTREAAIADIAKKYGEAYKDFIEFAMDEARDRAERQWRDQESYEVEIDADDYLWDSSLGETEEASDAEHLRLANERAKMYRDRLAAKTAELREAMLTGMVQGEKHRFNSDHFNALAHRFTQHSVNAMIGSLLLSGELEKIKRTDNHPPYLVKV